VTNPRHYRAYYEDYTSRVTLVDAFCVSTFMADLYAIGILGKDKLCDAIYFVVDNFTKFDHLIPMIILLSRANTEDGERLENRFLREIMRDIRRRCIQKFGHTDSEVCWIVSPMNHSSFAICSLGAGSSHRVCR